MRIDLKFKRSANVIEKGLVSLDVEKGTPLEDILKNAQAFLFSEFLTTEREYDYDEWEFSLADEEEEPETGPEAA